VTNADRAYGMLKSVLLMNERFDSLDKRMKTISDDLSLLSRDHAELAQRVARIEGVMEGYARASDQRRLPDA